MSGLKYIILFSITQPINLTNPDPGGLLLNPPEAPLKYKGVPPVIGTVELSLNHPSNKNPVPVPSAPNATPIQFLTLSSFVVSVSAHEPLSK